MNRTLPEPLSTLREITVPVVALSSRRDGIVNREACIDRSSDCVEHIEVYASHLGMGINHQVLRLVAQNMR